MSDRHSRRTTWLATWLVALATTATATAGDPPATAAPAAAAEIDYNRDVRPILAETCYACHGPDAKARKADLRLDQKDDAFRDRGGYAAIVAGDVESSELLARIVAEDAEEVMPPPTSGKTLTEAQRRTLREWVASGAQWDGHWAYLTPKAPAEPPILGRKWARNAIDLFALEEMEKRGLRPSPEADRATLIRRLAFDLTGLPPTPAEVDAFVADDAPDAYERLVDRLLASPHYGERMAQDWMDVARYADTNGYHIDNHRDLWKWREWVVGAFNKNQPFDRFTVEQIAGDLLPGATVEQKIASGFNRNTMVNFEGGADPDEYLTKYVVDRVTTTATVYMGATLACAECHDHKYDPFTQKDFYRFYGFFNTIDEKGLDGNFKSPQPLLQVPTADQESRRDEIAGRLASLVDALKGPLPEADSAQEEWESRQSAIRANPSLGWVAVDPAGALSRNAASLAKQEDLSILAGGFNPSTDMYEVVARVDLPQISGIRLEALTHANLPHKGASRSGNGNFVLTGFELEVSPAGDAGRTAIVPLARAEADFAQTEGGDFAAAKAIDADPTTGWAVQGDKRREDRTAVFAAASPIEAGPGTIVRFRLRFESIYAQHTIGRFRLALTAATAPALDLVPPANIAATLAIGPADRAEAQRREVQTYFRDKYSPEAAKLKEQIAAATKEGEELDKQIPVTMVMREQAEPRETFVLMRGDFRVRGEKVEPGVPASLPPLPEGAPANRLGLANWLVDPANPLVARVTVNRFWQHYFGTGLVKTANDFGSQGEWPSHPKLLDWLARTFVDGGWDVKAIQKQIVTSATYRQSSHATPELIERDPENRYLARGPRFRLDAESIRDNALAISGLLDRRLGGPSVYPFQPPGLWEELAIGREFSSQYYKQSEGADQYRRGLYVYWKRSVPPPNLTAFDAPNREVCTVTRPRTNTPLQALALLNDPVFVECARVLAARVLREGGATADERLDYAMRLCVARRPNDRERAVLAKVLDQQLDNYRRDPKGAAALISVGKAPRAMDLDPAELAAWTALANVLMNLDESVTKG